MRNLAVLFIFAASPAFAHHEVVMTTSFLPFVVGLAMIVISGLAGLRQRIQKDDDEKRQMLKTE